MRLKTLLECCSGIFIPTLIIFMKNLNSTVVLIGSMLIGVVLFAVLLFYMRNNKTPETATLPITLEEFADFECPACRAYQPVVTNIMGEFSEEEFVFKYRHLPLTQIHPHAYNSAIASEAAREQGKFKEYGALLYENQDNLTDEDLLQYAVQLELDMEKFQADLDNPEMKERVDNDMKEADARNYQSTPTFVLDGKRISMTSNPEEQLRKAIQERIDLAKSQQTEKAE